MTDETRDVLIDEVNKMTPLMVDIINKCEFEGANKAYVVSMALSRLLAAFLFSIIHKGDEDYMRNLVDVFARQTKIFLEEFIEKTGEVNA